MPCGYLSARIDAANERHHLWLNNGTWWGHYTLNFDVRRRRVRRSLRTRSIGEAIRRRDVTAEMTRKALRRPDDDDESGLITPL